MPRYINTYSKSRPILRKAERDAFSELTRSTVKGALIPKGLELIAESENEEDDDKKLVQHSKPRIRSTRTLDFMPSGRISQWNPTHLKIEGKPIKIGKTSPFVAADQTEETEDGSILFLSDSSEESSTLSDTEPTVQTSGKNEDSCSQYSDIEVPRDLPEEKRKSRSVSTQILKLSQLSNIQPSKLKSQRQVIQNSEKPVHSTMLEGKFSSMCIDQYGISDISGNGTEYHISDSSAVPLETEASSNIAETAKRSSKLVPVSKRDESKAPKSQVEAKLPSRRSVYSLNSSDDDSSLHGLASRQQDGGPSLKVTGRKVHLVKKNLKTSSLSKQSKAGSRDGSSQSSKKQVSFLLGTKPEIFEPSEPSAVAISHIPLPHLSPSNSILKKKTNVDPPLLQEKKLNRATSTPQKFATHSKRKHGCHIMDLSFDVSAVSLPSDSDLIIPPNSPDKENVPCNLAADAGNTLNVGEMTEKLLDFEPMCLEASQNIGSLLETTPVKAAENQERGEMTPHMQVKRSSPDIDKPSKQLAKKSRIIQPVRNAISGNRKRLNYQAPLPTVDLVPECVITQLPFTGYRDMPPSGIVQPVSTGKSLDVENFPQDVLETIPDSVFLHPSSAVGCNG